MNMGNFSEDYDWAATKVDLLEQLVRYKAEHCPIFIDTLKKTYGYRLVENTWSHFWVWEGTYKGLNHFGRLLERVRESS